MRPNRPHDQPRTFVEALRYKYASDAIDRTSKTEDDPKLASVVGARPPDQPIKISGKEVEEVGFEKIRSRLAELSELRIVLLDGLCIHRPLDERRKDATDLTADEVQRRYGSFTDVSNVSPRIVELDLSRNLFEDWREIVAICSQLEHLRSLRVDGNRFSNCSFTDCESRYLRSVFGKFKSLSFEDMLLQWQEVVTIVSFFGSLSTLALSGNRFGSLARTDFKLFPQTVTQITLEYNDFASLDDVSVLSSLSALRKLILKNNSISSPGSLGLEFPSSLAEIDLSHNDIDDWSFISALHSIFPGMISLRIAHNPLFQNLQAPDGRLLSADDGYMLTIARLSRLKSLNYSTISDKDRLNAESYYLSLIAQELSLAPENQAERVIARHPRYQELCEEYGEPTIKRSGERQMNPNSLAAQLIKFRFRLQNSGVSTLSGDKKILPMDYEVELLKSLSIYSVQGIVGKHFGLQPWKLRLVWETGEWDFGILEKHRDGDGEWDSEEEDQEDSRIGSDKVKREVELLPGTRTVGTWVEGDEVDVRVEIRGH